ncbi:hypothetical protein COT97_02880 [Candidatus Falkowbacteria bacterium CG10_big_fil_rev_8_21_14_0_10_39_11]|uniref:VTT domain-containing protein n=1 Tax=Candidatus Falkowbacteria bacterium CG10_big_fil_rev_8_21_14_0_10_39_11 TaxID=1974565 RepID=A0A2H0V514_9BACT|nr:MAG: hypothetical protein COT97_02880 [Candidatus Falkowbacteria bacterium CG10_big_fil_rev_8_21_14_0_10_39_11]
MTLVTPIYFFLFIIIGTFIEGETVLIASGYIANAYHYEFWLILVLGLIGTLVADQLYFFLGRYCHRHQILPKFIAKRLTKVQSIISNHQNKIIIFFRFLIGFRMIIPFFLGYSNVNTKKFIIIDLISGFIWTLAFIIIGFSISLSIDKLIPAAKSFEYHFLIVFLCLIVFLKSLSFIIKKINKHTPNSQTNIDLQ